MSGNDIVDIKTAAAESNWQRKGYIEKIFTSQEQQFIKNAAIPNKMVWRLWTMKESAYKIYTRQCGGCFFAPQKFSCFLQSAATGIVVFNNQYYPTTTITQSNYIYSIARPKAIADRVLMNSCFYLPRMLQTKQQQFIYKKIIDGYNSLTEEPDKNVAIVKDKNGIPFLNCVNNRQIPVSITHHGRFAAFTIN
jgi:phosphopantetheinyl transferase (holo-ACP synthase)